MSHGERTARDARRLRMLHTRTSVDYMARLPQPSPQASHFWLGGARGAPSLCYQMKIRYPEVPVLSLPLPTKSPLHARACCPGAAQASAQIIRKKKDPLFSSGKNVFGQPAQSRVLDLAAGAVFDVESEPRLT